LLGLIGRRVSETISGVTRSVIGALEKLIELPRNIKQAFLLLLDLVFVFGAMLGALALAAGHTDVSIGLVESLCALTTLLCSAIVFLRLGLYRAVIRFMGQQAIWAIITAVSYSTLVFGATLFFTRVDVPRSVPFF